jgi:hypothetical protein
MTTNLVNIKIWHDALLSGQYPQGSGTLLRDGRYCCLGVATHEAIKHGVTGLRVGDDGDGGFVRVTTNYTETDTLPPEVKEWLGVDRSDPELVTEAEGSVSASSLNDEWLISFEEIAACIRATWPDAFPLVGSDEVAT